MKNALLLLPGLLACAVAQANDALNLPDTLITASRQVEERSASSAAITPARRSQEE